MVIVMLRMAARRLFALMGTYVAWASSLVTRQSVSASHLAWKLVRASSTYQEPRWLQLCRQEKPGKQWVLLLLELMH